MTAWIWSHLWQILLGLMLGLLLPQRLAGELSQHGCEETSQTGDQSTMADKTETEQVVLSVEGQDHIDKDLWATHEVLGIFESEAAAEATIPAEDLVYNIYLISNLTTGVVRRVEGRAPA